MSKRSIIYMHVHVFNILFFFHSFYDFSYQFSVSFGFDSFFCWRFRIKHKFPIGRGKYTFTSHQKQGDDLHDTSKNWINIKIGVSEYETSGKHEYEVFRTMNIARKMGKLKEKIRKRIDYRNVMGQHTETEEKRRRKIL